MTEYTNAPNAYTNLSGTNYAKGLYIADSASILYGHQISDVQFYAYRTNTDSGKTLYARVRNSSGTLKHTFWSMPYNSLSTSSGTLTAETSTPYTSGLAVDDVIVLEVDPAPSTAVLYFGYHSSDNFDSVNTTYTGRNADGTFSSLTDYDSGFYINTGAATGGVRLPPPPGS